MRATKEYFLDVFVASNIVGYLFGATKSYGNETFRKLHLIIISETTIYHFGILTSNGRQNNTQTHHWLTSTTNWPCPLNSAEPTRTTTAPWWPPTASPSRRWPRASASPNYLSYIRNSRNKKVGEKLGLYGRSSYLCNRIITIIY